MKNFNKIFILSATLFVIITFISIKNEAASDGDNEYGFPFVFYRYTDGKCNNCNQGFNLINLLLDILISFSVSGIIMLVFNKRKKS